MDSTTTFRVRFILRHNPVNVSEAQIYAQIIINGKRTEIYANRSIHADCWNPERQCAVGNKELVNRINPLLEEVRYKLTDCYQQLKLQNAFITDDSSINNVNTRAH